MTEEEKRVQASPKSINPEVSLTASLEFEVAYYDVSPVRYPLLPNVYIISCNVSRNTIIYLTRYIK